MAEVVALEFALDAGKANMTLGELEEGFESMQKKLRTVGRGSEEFKTLTTAMAGTSAEIKNIELAFEGLDKEQVASELGGLAGGIGDVTASLVLMGGENETIEQIGASIEKAMAISMGFKGAIEGAAAANKLYNNIIKQGKVAIIAKSIAEKAAAAGTWLLAGAQTALNAIMALNPIALVVLAVGGLIAGFVALGGSIMSLIKTALAPMQTVIDGIISTLRWLGIMQSESAVAAEEAADAIEQSNVRQQQAYAETLRKLKKLADAEKKRTDAVISDMDRELARRKASGLDTEDLERKRVLSIRDTTAAELKALETRVIIARKEWKIAYASGSISVAVANQKLEALQALEAESEALSIQLKDDTNDVYVFNRGIRKAEEDDAKADADAETSRRKTASDKRTAQREKDKAAAEKAAEDAKKIAEQKVIDDKKLAEELIKTLDDLDAKAIDDKNVRALAEKELAHARERESLILKHGENAELLAALDAAQLLEMNALDDSIEQEAITKEAERVAAAKAIKDAADEAEKAAAEKAAADKKARRDKDFADATAAIGALSALNKAATDTALLNAAGDEVKKEKIRKASFEREKKLNIAMALINGAQAVLAGFAQGGLPMAIVAGVTAAAQLAAIVATTYQGGAGAGVETPTQEPSPDGAGAGGRGAQINAVSNTSTLIGDQNVTVTETDITSTQNKVKVIEESATF